MKRTKITLDSEFNWKKKVGAKYLKIGLVNPTKLNK